MLRVDHAGELGAERIYAGQLVVLGESACGGALRHMYEQEVVHYRTFDRLLQERKVRPTVLQPLWRVMGFTLGVTTAMLGEKAAMACTVAIEDEIDAHYARQYDSLPEGEQELKEIIERFRAEELEHRDTGLDHAAERTLGYRFLYRGIRTGSKLAIWLSERI